MMAVYLDANMDTLAWTDLASSYHAFGRTLLLGDCGWSASELKVAVSSKPYAAGSGEVTLPLVSPKCLCAT